MGWDLNIDAAELRASAGAAETLVVDLEPPLKKALNDLTSAGTAFRTWSVGSRLQESSEGWGAALGELRNHLSQHAQGLRLLADGRDIMEQDVIAMFRGW